MTEEQLKVADETKECNCPVCRVLRSECTKKFLAVVLASFIGCSLALLVFAPKKHHRAPRPLPPNERFMDRPMPPIQHFRKIEYSHEFMGERRMPAREFQHHNPNAQAEHKKFDAKRQGMDKRNKIPQSPVPVKVEQPIIAQ